MNKRLTVIITWRDRDELELTLKHNVAAFDSCCSEVIIVNVGGDSRRLRQLSRAVDFKFKQIDLPCHDFNKALSLNIGSFFSRADSEWLFFLDADILLDREVLEDCVNSLADGSFINILRVNESQPEAQSYHKSSSILREVNHTYELVLMDGKKAKVVYQSWLSGSRTGNGLIIVQKSAFVQINGANADLKGWGFEDADIQLRLQFALNLKRMPRGHTIHLTHSDKLRDMADAPHRDITRRRNLEICMDNYLRGNFLGTYARDVSFWKNRAVEISGDRREWGGPQSLEIF